MCPNSYLIVMATVASYSYIIIDTMKIRRIIKEQQGMIQEKLKLINGSYSFNSGNTVQLHKYIFDHKIKEQQKLMVAIV